MSKVFDVYGTFGLLNNKKGCRLKKSFMTTDAAKTFVIDCVLEFQNKSS